MRPACDVLISRHTHVLCMGCHATQDILFYSWCAPIMQAIYICISWCNTGSVTWYRVPIQLASPRLVEVSSALLIYKCTWVFAYVDVYVYIDTYRQKERREKCTHTQTTWHTHTYLWGKMLCWRSKGCFAALQLRSESSWEKMTLYFKESLEAALP